MNFNGSLFEDISLNMDQMIKQMEPEVNHSWEEKVEQQNIVKEITIIFNNNLMNVSLNCVGGALEKQWVFKWRLIEIIYYVLASAKIVY